MISARRAATTLLGTMWLCTAGCHGLPRASRLQAADRARVYAAVLADVRRDSSTTWVVVDSLLPARDIDADLYDKVISELAISRQALDAFLVVQRAPDDQFEAAMLPGAQWSPVSMARLDALRAASRVEAAAGVAQRVSRGDGFWNQWRRAFPGASGYVILSPASIARDGRTAVVHVRVACGEVCGESELRLLHRDAAGTWHTTGRVRLSES